MATGYLIDTSSVIKYLNGSLIDSGLAFIDQIINDESAVSFITEIELQVWNPPNEDDLKVYKTFVSGVDIIGIDQLIIAETIEIRKTCHLKLPDALIAATAITKSLTLIADNDKDFGRVGKLKCINPNNI